jgi:hypothetical protein
MYLFPVKDKFPTPVPIPSEIPFLEIDFGKKSRHTGYLWSNTEVGERRKNQKKPVGVIMGVVRWGVFDTHEEPPQSISDLRYLLFTSDCKFTLNFWKERVGKKIYYSACWLNTRGEVGTWTSIISAVVN